MPERKGKERHSQKTNIEVDRDTSERVDRLVGRFGRTKGEVISVALDRLEQGTKVAA